MTPERRRLLVGTLGIPGLGLTVPDASAAAQEPAAQAPRAPPVLEDLEPAPDRVTVGL